MYSETTKVVGLLGALTALLGGACKESTEPDARITQPPIDASVPTPDAESPDAMPKPSFSGTISLQEVSLNGAPTAGQGLQITISFSDDAVAPGTSLDTDPGTPFGCKVWEYTPTEAADVGEDQGTVSFTATDGTPALPDCTFDATNGYLCIGSVGMGGTVAVVNAAMGLYSLTDADTDFTGATGRYLKFPGHATLTGNYPIVMQPAMATIIFVSTTPIVPITLAATAVHLTIAGLGPIPGTADPGFLEDDDEILVELASGGAGDFEDFMKTFSTAGGGVGDDFVLSTASQGVISNIPTNGSTFTIGCSGAGGTCNVATGSLLSITTTDGVVTGLSPFTMPAPLIKEVSIRCSMLGADQIVVPPEVSAFIMDSGATRIQATFIRANLQQASNTAAAPAIANTNIVAGHGVVGFTSP